MSFNINDLPNTIKIGYVGQEANSIEFDISAWKAKDQSVVCEITMVAPFSELEFEPMAYHSTRMHYCGIYTAMRSILKDLEA